jgi:hypothetical protein
MDPAFRVCWSCQAELAGREPVEVADGVELPCCMDCWQTIPTAQRLVIAQKYHDRPEMGSTLETARDVLKSLLGSVRSRAAFERELQIDILHGFDGVSDDFDATDDDEEDEHWDIT